MYSLRKSTQGKKATGRDRQDSEKPATNTSDVMPKPRAEAAGATATGNPDTDCELANLMNTLSPESKALAEIITKTTGELKSEIRALKEEVTKKDQKIAELTIP